MSALLPFLIALFLPAFFPAAGPPIWAGMAALLAAYYAGGRALGSTCSAAAERSDAEPGEALRSMRRAITLHRWGALVCHGLLLGPGGLSTFAADVGDRHGLEAGLLVSVLPYPILLLVSVASTHPGEHRVGMAAPTLLRTYGRNGRLFTLMALPVLLLLGLRGAALYLARAGVPPFLALEEWTARWDVVSAALFLGAMGAVTAFLPVLGMKVLGARPMEPGPMRERLERYAARTGLRCRDLYVWNTGGSMVNAAVLGVGARLRCVVFTDALLDRLDPDEVEAVFAHEAGHALHHHLPLFFLFTVGSLMAMSATPGMLPPAWSIALESSEGLQAMAFLVGVILYFGLVFGFLSRRLEQQADVHGLLTVDLPEGVSPAEVLARPERHPFLEAVAAGAAVPGDHPFVRSLERIAATMGGVREITGWRHFSIADRVEFLERFTTDPAVRADYRTRLRRMLGVGALALVVFAAAASTELPSQWAGPHPQVAVERARAALARGDTETARRWIAEGAEGARARSLALTEGTRRQDPSRPTLRLASLEWSARAGNETETPWSRARAGMLDALARSLLDRPEDAAHAAAHAEGLLTAAAADPDLPSWQRKRLQRVRAGALLLWGDLLEKDHRPAAAREAWAQAREAAERAGDAGIAEAAGGRR